MRSYKNTAIGVMRSYTRVAAWAPAKVAFAAVRIVFCFLGKEMWDAYRSARQKSLVYKRLAQAVTVQSSVINHDKRFPGIYNSLLI